MTLLLGQDKKTQLIMFTQINAAARPAPTHPHTHSLTPASRGDSESVWSGRERVHLEPLHNRNFRATLRRSVEGEKEADEKTEAGND